MPKVFAYDHLPVKEIRAKAQKVGFQHPLDLLPDPDTIARKLKDAAEMEEELFVPADDCGWSELDAVHHTNFRVLKLLFISEMKGSGCYSNAISLIKSYWCKNRLINTLQAAKHILDSSHSMKHLLDVVVAHQDASRCQYNGQFGKVLLDWQQDAVNNSATVKLLHMLCLMTFIGMPGRHVGEMTQLNATALRFARMLCHPPPESMLFECYVSFDEVLEASGPGDDKQPLSLRRGFNIDPDWLRPESSLVKVTRLYLEQLQVGDRETLQMRSPEWFRARADMQILCLYRDFLSNVVSILRGQLDVASTLHTKVLGGLATLLFAGVSFLFEVTRFKHRATDLMQTVVADTFNHTSFELPG